MKVVALGQAKNELSNFVEQAQHDRVLITRHGRPAVVMIGVEGQEIEDVMTRSDPGFWAMLEERRRESKPVSAEEARRRLGLEPRPTRTPRARTTHKKRTRTRG